MSIFFIAEIGINHNGDINLAKKLMRVAKDAGCDAVKFQKRTIEKVYSKEQLDKPRESPWGTTTREQKYGLEFSEEQYRQIDACAKEIGIEWFASAWDMESQLFLRKFDLKYNKIASAMLPCEKFLKLVAEERKYTFIATGMSTREMIDRAVAVFRDANCPFELMHCVSTYPMNEAHANLRRIETLRGLYHCKVGYSGHEVGLAISYAAAALGATSIERHITLDRSMYGSDQAASVEPMGLRQLVGAVRKIEQALGDGSIDMQSEERAVAEKLRGHLGGI
ncbi:MAG: N-acetylneuraminate synthase family protein [Lentisphaeria bacterium]|nr:N-acetylneuraminate synthase family protein [Lentisphaeria bacterium]